MSEKKDTENPGNPLFSSTPFNIRDTPLGRPVPNLPGTLTSKFVQIRRRVNFRNMNIQGDGTRAEGADEIVRVQTQGGPSGQLPHFGQVPGTQFGVGPAGRDPPGGANSDRISRDFEDDSMTSVPGAAGELVPPEQIAMIKAMLTKYKDIEAAEAEYQDVQEAVRKTRHELECMNAAGKMREQQLQVLAKQLEDKAKELGPGRIMGARKSVRSQEEDGGKSPPRAPPVNHTVSTGVGQMQMPFSINVVQQAVLPPFEIERGDDPRVFLDNYEKLTVQLPNRARVDGFGAYLRGSASYWATVLERDLKEVMSFNEDGLQSTSWAELKWSKLRAMFEREFAEKRTKEIFRTNQGIGELGLTYFYRMVKVHQQSGLDLNEEQLATLIIEHMADSYRDKFECKDYDSLKKLREDIKFFDDKRQKELVVKRREKRTANLALLETEADDHIEKKNKTAERGADNKHDLQELYTRINSIQQKLDSTNRNVRDRKDYRERSPYQQRDRRQRSPDPRWSRGDDRDRGRGQRGGRSGGSYQRNFRGEYETRKEIKCWTCGKLGSHIGSNCRSGLPINGKRGSGRRTFTRNDVPAIEDTKTENHKGLEK